MTHMSGAKKGVSGPTRALSKDELAAVLERAQEMSGHDQDREVRSYLLNLLGLEKRMTVTRILHGKTVRLVSINELMQALEMPEVDADEQSQFAMAVARVRTIEEKIGSHGLAAFNRHFDQIYDLVSKCTAGDLRDLLRNIEKSSHKK